MKTPPSSPAVPIEPAAPTIPPPSRVTAQVTPGWDRVRVVDATTGETIAHVIEADVDAGTVTRRTIVDGHLVRDRDDYATVKEGRAIRIEWIDAA